MEAYLGKSSVERSSQSQMVHDLAIAVAARKEAEAREKSAEMFAAATAAQKAETNAIEELRLLTYALKTRFNKEICEWHSINMKLIDQLFTENYKLGQQTRELLISLTEPASKHFATHINKVSKTANPIIKKFTELILHPQKVERPGLLPVICDLFTNINKQTGAQWSDNSKTMFALIRDFGGPALLANQIRERFGGPSLATLYKTVRLPYTSPQTLEQLSFPPARDVFDRLEIQGPFILAVDATPVIPSLKVRGNKIFGLAQRDQVVVKSAEDIIRVVEDTCLEKTKLVNAFVIASVHLSEPFFVLALSLVMKGENSQTVSCWFGQAVQMAVDNNLSIIGIGADGHIYQKSARNRWVNSRFRRFRFCCCCQTYRNN